MAVGVKISQLPVATSTVGTELAVIVQQGETRQVTIDQFVAPVATSINAVVSLKAFRTGDYLDAVQYIEFDTSTVVPSSVGRLSWNLDDGTLNLGLIGGNVVNQLGQELVQRCYNNTGAPIAEGSVVKVVGATGQRLTIELAQANNDANSLTVIGVATETIADKALGYVATEGFVRGVDTKDFTDGDVLWLSPTTPGQLTNVKPVAPQHMVMIGYVVKGGSVGAGSIFVKVQNGYELGELHDVKVSTTTSLANNEILAYNTSAGVWTNSTLLIDVQNSISALTDRVAAVSAATSVNAATVSALEIRVSGVSALVSSNAAAIVSTNNIVSALQIRVSNISTAVSVLQQEVALVNTSAVNARIDAVSAATSANAAAITSVNGVVSALEIRVSSVSAAAAATSAAVVSVNNVVSALEIRVSAVSAVASANAVAITSINNVVSALEIRVSAVSAAVVAASAAITSVNAAVSLKVNRSGDTMTGPLTVNVSSASDALRITQTGAGNALVVEDSANPDATPFVVNASGNVGIGMAFPTASLSVYGTVGAQIEATDGTVSQRVGYCGFGAAFSGTASNHPYLLLVNDSERMRIDTSGNVGIGTANPGSKLHVAGDVRVNSINSGPLAGFRNAIINGNFDIWQRGTSFSNPASGTGYTADRWYPGYDGSGATRVLSRQDFTLGQTDVPNEPQYFFRFAQSVAGTAGTFNTIQQKIEGVRTFAGQQVTLSFYARAAASLTMPAISLGQFFGTGGSPSSEVSTTVTNGISVDTSWAKYTYTVNLPSISGKTLGSDNNDFLRILFFLPINTTFTFDLAQVQLEVGPVATPFERRPIGTELALCQRYYYKTYSPNASPGAVDDAGRYTIDVQARLAAVNRTTIAYPTMRAAPSIIIYNPMTGNSGTVRGDDGQNYNSGVYVVGNSAALVDFIPLTPTAAVFFHFTASAEL